MQKEHFLYINARKRSFQYACSGIQQFFRSEPNSRLHLIGTVVAILGIILLHLNRMETIAIVFSIGFVWVSEIFNTCIEKVMDFISLEKSAQVKSIKDMAAGAVLASAIVALVTGLIIFIPKIIL